MPKLRNLVKPVKDYLIWSAITGATISVTNTVIDEPTENQETAIELGATAVGFVAMKSIKSRTDQMVDSVADWRKNRKIAEADPAV